MPVVLRVDGFEFFFYSNENQEPAHIHVEKGEKTAKFWLAPVSLASNKNFNTATLTKLHSIVRQNEALLLRRWNDYFSL
jgi:hypothetical protein